MNLSILFLLIVSERKHFASDGININVYFTVLFATKDIIDVWQIFIYILAEGYKSRLGGHNIGFLDQLESFLQTDFCFCGIDGSRTLIRTCCMTIMIIQIGTSCEISKNLQKRFGVCYHVCVSIYIIHTDRLQVFSRRFRH